jgi:ABC-2 type transport system ATP-binding protein
MTMDKPLPAAPQGGENTGETTVFAHGLTKRFDQVVAVDGISLDVRAGEFFGFLGPNGAGKSTTIRMLCGLLRPTAGAIRIAGYDLFVDPIEVKRRIGVLPEELNLYERLSAEEFLDFSGKMHGIGRDEVARRTVELLHLMELTDDKDKLIVDYSMGMKKKVALAAALIHAPKVLFLDEPFSGIDAVSTRAIRNVLHRLTERGTTIFFSSHVLEVVERLCTRAAIIHRGHIVGCGTMDELRAQAQSGSGSSLEDVFLTLVEARTEDDALSWIS